MIRSFRPGALAIAASLAMTLTGLGVACSSGDPGSTGASATTSATAAATLRSDLNAILQEHVNLAAAATNAALSGDDTRFKAAAAALDANSVDLARIMGSVYGPNAETAFLDGWRRHIGFFVDYMTGRATNDEAKMAKAREDLATYALELATLLNAANGLPVDAVVEITKSHTVSLMAVIDAQAAGNQEQAFMLQREAASHMTHFADPLAEATVQKFPEKFKG